MQLLLSYVKHFVPLSAAEEKALIASFRVTTYNKGHILNAEGAVCHHLYFVLQGICRTFHDHTRKEVTTWIYPEGHFITAWSSFMAQSPSHESIEVLEDNTQVAYITKPTLETLYEQHRAFERFGRMLVEEQLAFLDDYARGYHLLSARQKYENLLAFFPEITQRVNLGHVASMLGITQETLSRIRRQD